MNESWRWPSGGELTPASAAGHTGLTVDEAHRMLEELADRGQLKRRDDHGVRTYALPGLEDLLPLLGGAVASIGPYDGFGVRLDRPPPRLTRPVRC